MYLSVRSDVVTDAAHLATQQVVQLAVLHDQLGELVSLVPLPERFVAAASVWRLWHAEHVEAQVSELLAAADVHPVVFDQYEPGLHAPPAAGVRHPGDVLSRLEPVLGVEVVSPFFAIRFVGEHAVDSSTSDALRTW